MVVAIDSNYTSTSLGDIYSSCILGAFSDNYIGEIVPEKSISIAFETLQQGAVDNVLNWGFASVNSTGGMLIKQKGSRVPTVIEQNSYVGSKIDFVDKLKSLKATFAMTNEELAAALLSERKTVQNWLAGSCKPSKKKAKRLLELDGIAQMWNNSGYPADSAINDMKLSSGRSLLELLSADTLDYEAIMFHGSEIYLTRMETNVLEDPFA